MKTAHIEIVVHDDADLSGLFNTVGQEADQLNGTAISSFEMPSSKQEVERATEQEPWKWKAG